MLIGGIVLGLVLGLLAGGSLWRLANVQLRWIPILVAAVFVRFGTEVAIANGVELAERFRLPLFALGYALLLAGLWRNRALPGMSLAFVGILGNATAIVLSGGYMPIWEPSLLAAGLTFDDIRSVFHTLLPATLDANFVLRGGPLGDVIPIPLPIFRNVASIGDAFLSAGLGFFLFATVLRGTRDDTGLGSAGSGLAPGLAQAAALQRPVVMGSPRPSLAAPGASTAVAAAAPAIAVPRPTLGERLRRSPYVELAINGSFSALWTGQVISLFGDRVHQIAVAFLVLGITGSPLATAAVFFAATLPNLLFSPIAGTFVDRWDHRETMIVSDLLRAAIVVLIPVAATVNVSLIYPLTFLLTTISIFFRPARIAILPRIVRDDQLLPANSASWMAETMADILGYPLAGAFVIFLGPNLPLAFWIDAATYVASAALLWTIVVAPLERKAKQVAERGSGFVAEMREGWRFLRGETVLLANTLQATVAQSTLGVLLALTPVYAAEAIRSSVPKEAVYGLLEFGIGVGNLVGGFAIGLVGARLAKGRLVIAGYAGAGLCIALLALTDHVAIAVGLMIGLGVANMAFVIPSQTLFQQRTPVELMGRAVGFRLALVFGSMTLFTGVGGLLGEYLGAAPVIGIFGLLTMAAGLAGLLVPAVRDA